MSQWRMIELPGSVSWSAGREEAGNVIVARSLISVRNKRRQRNGFSASIDMFGLFRFISRTDSTRTEQRHPGQLPRPISRGN
jgi:hypothetical protein